MYDKILTITVIQGNVACQLSGKGMSLKTVAVKLDLFKYSLLLNVKYVMKTKPQQIYCLEKFLWGRSTTSEFLKINTYGNRDRCIDFTSIQVKSTGVLGPNDHNLAFYYQL